MTMMKDRIKTGWNLDNSYARLPKVFFSMIKPNPVRSPKLIKLNESLATALGLDIEYLQSKDSLDVFAGNQIPEGGISLAQAYAGHQFGYFTMLGDGRAMLLGEQIIPQGDRFDIQLKGSGRTPYSRLGDGRATLGPMLREYIISEAMYGLGIPTTRSLAVVTTGETVIRENEHTGAILTRIASSHIRVGTFQYAANWGSVEDIKTLADYTLQRHYPEVIDDENRYLHLLEAVIKRQAKLISQWQLVGFIHGVMNTDNMTISGETIDYGPCAFMDKYDPKTVFSSIDRHGRYAYGNQPSIGKWDLARFAETLLPLLHENQEDAIKIAEEAIDNFDQLYHEYWLSGMRRKLGLFNEEKEDESLINKLLDLMEKHSADFTNTFRALTLDRLEGTPLFESQDFSNWYKLWQERLGRQEESKDNALELMKKSNPSIIPRNHRVEEALEAAVKYGDFSVMDKLIDVILNPFEYSTKQEEYSKLPQPSKCGYRTFCGT